MSLQLIAAGIKRRHKKAPEQLSELRKQAILDALHTFGGHRRKAAQRLGISIRALYYAIKQIRELQ